MTNEVSFRFAIGKSDDGKYIACSDVEPVFCFICDSEEQAKQVAQGTYEDYQRRFFNRNVRVTNVTRVPVVRVRDSQRYALTEAVA